MPTIAFEKVGRWWASLPRPTIKPWAARLRTSCFWLRICRKRKSRTRLWSFFHSSSEPDRCVDACRFWLRRIVVEIASGYATSIHTPSEHRHAYGSENLSLLVVRFPSRGSGPVLRVDLQRFEDHQN